MGSRLSAGPAELMGSASARASPPGSSVERRVLHPAAARPRGRLTCQLRQQRHGGGVREQREGDPQPRRAQRSGRERGGPTCWKSRQI